MSRRELVSSSIAAVGLCCVTEQAPLASFTIDNNTVRIDLRKVPAVAKKGGAVRVVDLDRDINLIVVHPDKDRFAALVRSCTHGGAQVAYSRKNKTVICSSWGH
jgi:Rieske Fe-S protein